MYPAALTRPAQRIGVKSVGVATSGGGSLEVCVAIGGDTGPLHLAGIMGCPTVALFSRFSDPANATPEGPCTVLRAESLADLTVATVAAALPDL